MPAWLSERFQCWPNVGTTLFSNHTLPQPPPQGSISLTGYYNSDTTLVQRWHDHSRYGDTEI